MKFCFFLCLSRLFFRGVACFVLKDARGCTFSFLRNFCDEDFWIERRVDGYSSRAGLVHMMQRGRIESNFLHAFREEGDAGISFKAFSYHPSKRDSSKARYSLVFN